MLLLYFDEVVVLLYVFGWFLTPKLWLVIASFSKLVVVISKSEYFYSLYLTPWY